jgi:hypothetical protein
MPLVTSAGLGLGPGRKHMLIFTKKLTEFLSAPYSTCKAISSLNLKLMIDHFQDADYAYLRHACYLTGMQSYMLVSACHRFVDIYIVSNYISAINSVDVCIRINGRFVPSLKLEQMKSLLQISVIHQIHAISTQAMRFSLRRRFRKI